MKIRSMLLLVCGCLPFYSTVSFAQTPGFIGKVGIMPTSVTLEADFSNGESLSPTDDSYLSLDVSGTLVFDDYFLIGELKTSRLDKEMVDSFSLLGAYPLSDVSSVFAGYKQVDWTDALVAKGFFIGYSHLFPVESSGGAIGLSAALGFLKGDLTPIDVDESSYTPGLNFKASYMHPIDDKLTLSLDLVSYTYSYEFTGPGGSVDMTESNVGLGASASYKFQ